MLAIACGKLEPKGDIELKEFPISEFSGIEAKGKFRVFYVNSDKNRVEVESFPNFINNLDIDVQNGLLKIDESREVSGQDFYNVTIYSSKYPNSVKLSDSIEFNVSGDLKSKDLKISIQDEAKFIGSINADKATVEMQNGGLANFKGFVKNANISIKDTANVLAPYWMVDVLNIQSKNGTYAEMNVKDSIKGEIQNTAKFIYYGSPIRAFKIDPKATVNNKNLN